MAEQPTTDQWRGTRSNSMYEIIRTILLYDPIHIKVIKNNFITIQKAKVVAIANADIFFQAEYCSNM